MRYKPFGMIASCVALSCAATFASALEITGLDKQEVLPLALRGVYFVPNQGQWSDADVYFGFRSRGLDVAFRESAFTMHLARETGSDSRDREGALAPSLDAPLPDDRNSLGNRAEYEHLTLTVSFPGSNNVAPEGAKPQTAKFNYFVGGEERGVASDVRSFGAVVYHNLYDGVDLHVMGNDGGVLKYEFHVEPGADYGQIRISYDGIESLCVDDAGDLCIGTAFGTLADRAPVVWQEMDAGRSEAGARFDVCDRWTYRIVVEGEVDSSRALVIDPEVDWMRYLGGTGWSDDALGVAVDDLGRAFVVGTTSSADFSGRINEMRGGFSDAFVCRVDRAGELLWMTYLGGTGDDSGYAIAVDGDGSALVTGYTESGDFEGHVNEYHSGHVFGDAYVSWVSASGAVLRTTFLGGSGEDRGFGVTPSTSGDVLLAGYTGSSDFEGATNAFHGSEDGFVCRVSPSGQIRWTTYLGGGPTDRGEGIATDLNGNVFVAGYTSSIDFESRINERHGSNADAFLCKLSGEGTTLWALYLGGSGSDYGYAIALDETGGVFVSGKTSSTDFEGRINSYYGLGDAFVCRVDLSGALEWMGYYGGRNIDWGRGITVDGGGTVVCTGETFSDDFAGADNTLRGSGDAFVCGTDLSGSVLWMSYLGGRGDDYGRAVATTDDRSVMIAGYTRSSDFEGRLNGRFGGQFDGFVARLRRGAPALTVTSSCPESSPIQLSWTDATPGGQIVVVFARNTGSFVIPNGRPCAGTALELGTNQLQIVFQGSAGPEGSRTLNSNAGSAACGGYLQLIDMNTCSTSNAARIE